jgi:predicted benzoate:H+ symporter BenE
MSTHLFLSRPRFFRAFLAAFTLAAIALGLASAAHAKRETSIAYIDITYAGMTFDSAGNLFWDNV